VTPAHRPEKPIVFTRHAGDKLHERGASEEDVREAIRVGERERAQRGLFLYRWNREFNSVWEGRYYRVQQVAPVVAEEEDRLVVVTVYTFLLLKAAMKITYDREADALYIRILKGQHECRVVRVTVDVALDFTAGEQLVGIEVLGASRFFEGAVPEAVSVEDITRRAIVP
jgi:uncharacterized protein YuzE